MLGTDYDTIQMIGAVPVSSIDTSKRYLGNKHLLGENHLGSVLTVVSDRKIPRFVSGVLDHYEPDVLSATDYYPNGMIMPGRNFSSNSSRFLFDGMEQDPEIAGVTGADYTAEHWEYDARLGRRWNLEPEMKKYAGWSPYSCFTDNPILNSDPTGADPDPGGDKDKVSAPAVSGGSSTAGSAAVTPSGGSTTGSATVTPSGAVGGAGSVTPPAGGSTPPASGKPEGSNIVQTGAAIAGAVDQGYDMMKEDLLKPTMTVVKSPASTTNVNMVKGIGLGLNVLSTTLGAYDLVNQYQEEGSVNPVDATAVALGTVGTVSNALSLAGYTGVGLTATSYATGIGGIAIGTVQNWYGVYKPIFDMQRFNTPTTNCLEEQNAGQIMQNVPPGF